MSRSVTLKPMSPFELRIFVRLLGIRVAAPLEHGGRSVIVYAPLEFTVLVSAALNDGWWAGDGFWQLQ